MKRRLGRDLLAAADLDDLFGRDQHFVDLVLEARSATACLICSAIFFSKFERTLTEYQRFAMSAVTSSTSADMPRKFFYFQRFDRHSRNKKQRATRIDARRFLG